LAEWLTTSDSRLLARAFVNRVWKSLLGRGLVEPADDLRPTNPATHPALLEQLAAHFVEQQWDLRELVRTIVLSATYQRSSRTQEANRQDTFLYSHAYLKELPAPVFADAVAQVTGVDDVYENYTPGTRAVQLISPATPSPALDLLGRCQRKQSCDSSPRSGGGLALALHLLNGSTLNDKLQGAVFDQLSRRSDRDVVEEIYLRALSRRPETNEANEWERMLAGAANRAHAIQDLVWTVLNSREFAYNH
jgi:hypothetical protein